MYFSFVLLGVWTWPATFVNEDYKFHVYDPHKSMIDKIQEKIKESIYTIVKTCQLVVFNGFCDCIHSCTKNIKKNV